MPPEDDTRGSLERARERLYSQHAKPRRVAGHATKTAADTPHAWEQQKSPIESAAPHHHVRLALKFFWGALAFFVITSGVAAYLLFSGDRSVSTANVPITIQGPTTIAGGDTVALQISVTNNNPAAIENVSVALTFPPGTRSVADVLTPFANDIEDLGTIAPGGHVERTVKAVFFGGQGDTLTVNAMLQFHTSGSNATFVKSTNYLVSVVATPLSVSVDAPASAISGQPFTVSATVRSNAAAPISGVVLQADYPIGFTPTRTSIKSFGNSFPLGTLAPGATTTVAITGTLVGQEGEQRVMHFTVGTADSAQGTAVAVSYMTQQATLTISQPFLATALSLNGGSADHVVIAPSARANASLSWTNTLTVPITNAQIAVSFTGSAFDPASVQSTQGQYQSSTQTIVFSRDTDPALASLAPGAQGSGTFSFAALPADSASSTPGANPDITLSVTVSGQYPAQDGSTQTGIVSLSKTVKVTTALALDAYALHASGPFRNTGPIPPVANQPTTYTIVWSAQNTINDVAAANVTANLPAYVQFVGPTAPNDGSITYDAGAHTVTWNAGDIAAGASRQAAFQVSLTPSTSQRNSNPQLVGPATFSAFDRYAQVSISQTMPAVTTSLVHDPLYQSQPSAGTVQ
ncbi:MAG: hypothetical protein B7X04_00220 [Parcubacteria group bacterium 21-54-25]|nr:MAG: hypothetical protein B7X04_00220 [Parcubacteria group bacterium 21-54-25]HQU07517.1 hypothetical protein [Candidatus Paceibacterota bacterium]